MKSTAKDLILYRPTLAAATAFFTLLLSINLIHAGSLFPHVDAVAVSSAATPEYAAQKFATNPPKRETYVFFQGPFNGGNIRDLDLDHTKFPQIAKVLAENLVKQNYYPSPDSKNADLLISVQWGVTTIYDPPNLDANREELTKQSYFEQLRQPTSALFTDRDKAELQAMVDNKYGPYDGGSVAGAAMAVELDQTEILKQINANARLLGFDSQLAKTRTEKGPGSTDEITMLGELAEERFFVVLLAYDYRTMKKGTPPKLLWTSRLSIRATGNLFSTSVPVLIRTAAPYFGHDLDDLIKDDHAPEGDVDIGRPKVVSREKK